MRALVYQDGTVRAPVVALGAGEGPYRLHRAGDATWPPSERAYGGDIGGLWRRLAGPAQTSARIAVPVLLLAMLLGAAYLYMDAVLLLTRAPGAVMRAQPTISDLIIPMAWVSIHLTNRRLGAPSAFVQLVAGMLLVAFFTLVNPWHLIHGPGAVPAQSVRALLAFALAFFLANSAAIAVFDGVRGPCWWTAPLSASLVAALVFSTVYYPLAFAGRGQLAWIDSALVHAVLFSAESTLLLVPYWLLRPAMRPLDGLNGY